MCQLIYASPDLNQLNCRDILWSKWIVMVVRTFITILRNVMRGFMLSKSMITFTIAVCDLVNGSIKGQSLLKGIDAVNTRLLLPGKLEGIRLVSFKTMQHMVGRIPGTWVPLPFWQAFAVKGVFYLLERHSTHCPPPVRRPFLIWYNFVFLFVWEKLNLHCLYRRIVTLH